MEKENKNKERKIIVTYPDGVIKEGWVIEETENFIKVRLDNRQSVVLLLNRVSRNQCEEII